MAILGNILQGAVTGATGTYKDRLVDQLTRQREADLKYKQMTHDSIEKAVERGDMTWQEGAQRLADLWNDHKGNKQLIQEATERGHAIHNVFQRVFGGAEGSMNPLHSDSNPLGTGTYVPPPSEPPRGVPGPLMNAVPPSVQAPPGASGPTQEQANVKLSGSQPLAFPSTGSPTSMVAGVRAAQAQPGQFGNISRFLPPPPESSMQGFRIQQHAGTGDYRHSFDGGATWQPGLPNPSNPQQ